MPVKKPKVVDPAPEGMDWMEPQHVTASATAKSVLEC